MLLQPITVPFSKSTLKPSVYTLTETMVSLLCDDWIYVSHQIIFIKEYKQNLWCFCCLLSKIFNES